MRAETPAGAAQNVGLPGSPLSETCVTEAPRPLARGLAVIRA